MKVIDRSISTVKYSYSIDPLIYTYDTTGKLAKLNPSNLFSSIYNSNMLSSYSSFGSVFSQMIDDKEVLSEQYDVLVGTWPKKYNEMVIVLSEPNAISDLLVYSLGLRDNDELTEMVTKIMSGEMVNIDNKPLEFTYDDLMNITLKLIMPSDTYKYNDNYQVYEDMSEDDNYMKMLYDKALELKIVGIVSAKEGTTSTALSPGVSYTSELIDYIIDYSSKSELVKKQLANSEVDVFSGSRFDSKNSDIGFGFDDVISVDSEKLSEAFNINIDEDAIKNQTSNYMNEISNLISVDTSEASLAFTNTLSELENGLFSSIQDNFSMNDIGSIVSDYLNTYEVGEMLKKLESNYVIPKDTFKMTYSSLLNGLMSAYVGSYYMIDQSLTDDVNNPVAMINDDMVAIVESSFNESAAIIGTSDTFGKMMSEAIMKKTILTKVGELTANITSSIASSFNVDEDAISSAFSLNFTEEELMRVVGAMMNKKETTAKSNLISLGYQDKEEPTYISFYFNSFDGKEHFLDFIDSYNKKMEKEKKEDKVINYSDTTGILMNSVKTIVNAVSYVLIAFVSISLVVSSIMIGIITYISVYERTKEIGILRSIGASKRNISSIFNAETFIIGLLSGLFGIGISYGLIPIINAILHKYTGNIPLSAALNIDNALVLVVLSVILTLIGGLIPAKSASKKDPVEALRSE